MKNAKPSNTNETDYLERWFVGNYESMQEFHRDYNRKVIIAPKFLRMLRLKEEKLDEVRECLKF